MITTEKKQAIGFRLDPCLVRAVDESAAAAGISRSAWLTELIADRVKHPLPFTLRSLSRRIETIEKRLTDIGMLKPDRNTLEKM
jgi:predicted transcriptional regulator